MSGPASAALAHGLRFDNRFVQALPGDTESGSRRRQVEGALWSPVLPTPVARPRLLAHSAEMAQALGFDVVAFCLIGLNHQSDAELKAFADRTRTWPIVRAAWMVSGESDFMLHCVASDLVSFQTFVIEELTSTPNVGTVRSALTIRQVKDEGAVAIGEAG